MPGDCKHCVYQNNWWITMQRGPVSHTLPFKSLSEEWFLIIRSCYYSPCEREGINCLNNNEGGFGTKLLPKHLANAGGGSENGRRSSACRKDITDFTDTCLQRRIKRDGSDHHQPSFFLCFSVGPSLTKKAAKQTVSRSPAAVSAAQGHDTGEALAKEHGPLSKDSGSPAGNAAHR